MCRGLREQESHIRNGDNRRTASEIATWLLWELNAKSNYHPEVTQHIKTNILSLFFLHNCSRGQFWKWWQKNVINPLKWKTGCQTVIDLYPTERVCVRYPVSKYWWDKNRNAYKDALWFLLNKGTEWSLKYEKRSIWPYYSQGRNKNIAELN